MKKIYSPEYIAQAHRATIYHEETIAESSLCTCFYCGYHFDPQHEHDLLWLDERAEKGRTLTCPMCYVDCVIGNAAGFPITDNDFIIACSEAWFGGYSRISYEFPVTKEQITLILVP